MTTRATRYIPTLVVNMVGEFDAQELVEFLSFLGMLAHKLNVSDCSGTFDFILTAVGRRISTTLWTSCYLCYSTESI